MRITNLEMNKTCKGQISAEMLIVLAVLIAVAVFLAMQLTQVGKRSAGQVNQSISELECQQACMKIGIGCSCSDDDCPYGLDCIDGQYVADADCSAQCG